jgi:hypothetical protein
MTSGQLVAPYRGVPAVIVAVLLAAAFAIGTLTGLGVPRLFSAATSEAVATSGAGAARQAIGDAADNNMSDATQRLRFAPPFDGGTSDGVADNNLSEARQRLRFAPPYDDGTTKSVADDNMGDSTRAAQFAGP